FNRPLDIAGEPALEEIGFKLAADLEDHRLRRGFEAHRTVEEPRVTVPTNLPNQSLDQLRLIGGGADGLNWGRVNSHGITSQSVSTPGRGVWCDTSKGRFGCVESVPVQTKAEPQRSRRILAR